MIEVIFSEDDFTLCKEYGIGMSDTPWEGLIVKSSDAAEKHVVEVRLCIVGNPPYDGTPVKHRYDPERTKISHGMRMITDTFADTEEYIKVLEAALAFAKRVNQYIIDNDWT